VKDPRAKTSLKELVDNELATLKKEPPSKVDIIAEIKYDGERTQIHYRDGVVNLFSRNHKVQNQKFWLLKERLELYFKRQRESAFSPSKWQGIESFILDGEVVYVDA